VPLVKQYRETDGKFYFKLTTADGRLLAQSSGFAQGREAGRWIARLKAEGASALAGAPLAPAHGVGEDELALALQALAAATAA
jgi:tryptophanyl-tRNA synthetase